jgi:hypothetical protein
MTITFENDNKVIVYALETIISYAKRNQYIFLAQSIWWISSIIGLQQGLIIHIDNLTAREIIKDSGVEGEQDIPQEFPGVHPSRINGIQDSDSDYSDTEVGSVSKTETDIHNEDIVNCEEFLEQSKQERKAIGRITQQKSRVVKKNKPIKSFGTQSEGIDGNKLRRRKATGECQRCAWPRDRKGSHKTLDCFRLKRLEKGTAPFPKKKNYKKD